jgi:uncharacterized protein
VKVPTVDFHIHLFPPEVAANRERFIARDAGFALLYSDPRHSFPTAETALATLSAAEVDRALVCGFGWSDPGLCAAHNDYLADLVRRYPDRLSACAAAQPRDPAGAAAEIARCAGLGFRGVGELMPHLQGYSLDDPIVTDPLAEVVVASGFFVLTHASEPVGHAYPGKGDVTPDKLVALATRHPRLVIVAAHLGGGLPFYALMPEIARVTTNVYYDTAAASLLYRPAVFRVVAECVGADHLLFGSDYPLLRPERLLRRVRDGGLAERDLGLVLGGNAARLLGLAPPVTD